jgi:multiple sugar transport system permease protein
MTLHETKSSPIKQAASPDSTGWLSAKRKGADPVAVFSACADYFSWFKFIPMIQGL